MRFSKPPQVRTMPSRAKLAFGAGIEWGNKMFRKCLLYIVGIVLLLVVAHAATGWLNDLANSPFNSGNTQKINVDKPSFVVHPTAVWSVYLLDKDTPFSDGSASPIVSLQKFENIPAASTSYPITGITDNSKYFTFINIKGDIINRTGFGAPLSSGENFRNVLETDNWFTVMPITLGPHHPNSASCGAAFF